MKELVRITDSRKIEDGYVQRKFGYKAAFIDIEARNAFSIKLVTTSIIKCTNGYNPYGARQAMINKQLIGSECPRCNELETWDHVVRCKETKHLRRKFIFDLAKELLKHRPHQCSHDEVLDMTEDILLYLDNEDDDEYATSQHLIGMKYLFRGFVVKV